MIHDILCDDRVYLLCLFRHSSHVANLNFPPRQGTGIARLVPHASPECIDLMELLLAYDPEKRYSKHTRANTSHKHTIKAKSPPASHPRCEPVPYHTQPTTLKRVQYSMAYV